MTKHTIVLVPFPFDDFTATKVRPAVCLTNPVGKFNHLVIAFISSKIQREVLETDMLLLKKQSGFHATGLLSDSVIRVHKLVTIPENLIKRKLGVLDDHFKKEIDKKIRILFSD